MGKGGPLAFLNKKPWHPANFRNQEKIWEKEQAYMKEVEKREELKKQIEEQREEEGFQDFVAEATKQNVREISNMHRRKEDRVEWMYQGGFAAQEDADKRKEEYLLGKQVDKLPGNEQEEKARVDEIASGAGPAQSGLDFSATETWSRLNADPLLLIKRNEVSKVKAKTSNPYLVQQIKEQLRQAREAKVAKKKSKKEKREKRGKRSKSKRQRSSSGSGGESPSPPSKVRHASKGSPSPRCTETRAGEARMSDEPAPRSVGRARAHSPPSDDNHHGVHKRRRHDQGDADRQRGTHLNDQSNARSHSASKHESHHHNRREDGQHRDVEHDHRHRQDASHSSRAERRSEPRAGYGLQGAHIPEHARAGRESHAELTRAALDRRAQERAQEEKEARERAAAARRSYKPGKMSAADIEQRRREMEQNAGQIDQARARTLRDGQHDDADGSTGAANGRHAAGGRQMDTEEFAAVAHGKMLASTELSSLEGHARRSHRRSGAQDV